jgi:RNA polymerase-binding transcription factor DksA
MDQQSSHNNLNQTTRHLSAGFINEMKAKLLESKARLEQDLSGLSPHTEMGSDITENAEEIEVDEVNQDLIARMEADLEKINLAVGKIESGTYGVDSDGKEISEDRLRALPWAEKAI